MGLQATLVKYAPATFVSTVSTGITGLASSAIGREWLSVGFKGASAFGLIEGIVACAIHKFTYGNEKPTLAGHVIIHVAAGTVVYGASLAAAAAGVATAPLTLTTATTLTVVSATAGFFGTKPCAKLLIDFIKGLERKSESKKDLEETKTKDEVEKIPEEKDKDKEKV